MTSRATPDTEELLVRAGRGDHAARSELLSRHRDQLRRMVLVRMDRRLLPRLDPSDVVQEALIQAATELSHYLRDRPLPFYPWLRRLTWERLVRLHKWHVKARRRSVLRESLDITRLLDESAIQLAETLANSDVLPDHRLLQAELQARVLSALERLPDRDRELLVLRYLEQASIAEIASLSDSREAAVRTRLTRAVGKLVDLMNRNDK